MIKHAMIKHNAEMENSREESRACARLPLNMHINYCCSVV